MIAEKAKQQLYLEAEKAAENSYCPYSEFAVGAAVLDSRGNVFRGSNVENASFGLTICAERVALASAVAAGSHDIVAVAVYAAPDGVTPCGACRQFIFEFGAEIEVVFWKQGELVAIPIGQLLPEGFCHRRPLA